VSIREQNALMVDAFMGMYIIQADVDEWGFPPTGWDFKYIPVYFALDRDGIPTGAMIDGGAWGDNIPVNMAPPLKAFFESIRG
jgi:hypothetical protein